MPRNTKRHPNKSRDVLFWENNAGGCAAHGRPCLLPPQLPNVRFPKMIFPPQSCENIRLINVESINELRLVNNLGLESNKVINVGVRLNPDVDANTLDKISTGKKTDKFGIALNQLDEIFTIAKSSNFIIPSSFANSDNINGINSFILLGIKFISLFLFNLLKSSLSSSGILLKETNSSNSSVVFALPNI